MLKALQGDPLGYVRASLAEQVLWLCGVLGKKGANDHVLPIFLALLKDEELEVRVCLFKRVGELVRVLGASALLQTIIPALTELGNENNWRVRVAAGEHLTFFAKQVGEEFFSERVGKLIGALISDKIFAVRLFAGGLRDERF